MHRAALFAVLALFVAQCYGSIQLQMPEAAELHEPGEDDLNAQVKELQKNVTALWNYIFQLRNAVSHHLTHLRQHQVELESSMHRMDHLHTSDMQSSSHHHSGEQHSHSGEHHSHNDEHSHSDHSHGSMESHSHSDHSHGSMDGHSHGDHSHGSMEGHSHGDQHSHSGEHHHSDEHGHHSHSHSHSHSSHDHSKEDSHSHGSHDDHGHDHKDSHETEDLTQTQKVDPVAEPIVTATTREDHHHHHHQSFNSDSMNLLNEHSYHHHHHSHDSRSSVRNKTVVLPKYAEYGLYDLALCRVQPNSALSEDNKQNIFGTVTMWQKKTGGPLNFHVRLQGFDVGDHHAHHQQQQTVQTEEDNETPQPVSHTHGFHIHATGDLSNGCDSTGPHYNPKGVNHGKPGPDVLSRHVGDLGNIECDEHGLTNIVFSDEVASLRGQYSVIGKAIVIHANRDDLGLGGDAGSLSHGNAGPRLACCVIQSVDKIPIRQYKSMKSATQRNN